MIDLMSSNPEIKEQEKLKVIDNLTYKTFVNKFNTVYGQSLLPEQKELMTRFVMSFSDNGVELKSYLNEEIGRLKTKIENSLVTEDFKNDPNMASKANLVLEKMNSYSKKQVDKEVVGEVLKIQTLAKELEE
jgi:hypothetical protein